ncbi:MAG: hypothetical protein BECKG1743D_GA0114223_101583 [Candidatus Kentron sp. G]|nr:MAG: hypothetical protein BECKG1743F_GA0114225_101203 [Candidatus Kentron sp. G]VFM97313.1 MAG: hypothetical protein BECKG1743E_GA0114224_101246 [Candidatus Kentron sp. G]VFM99940.1 MAG: hypothetical protein BECKG1743D_GA0114223_101583 [Candidatus Kentron sp. G]
MDEALLRELLVIAVVLIFVGGMSIALKEMFDAFKDE